MSVELILGGARSGKSRYALQHAIDHQQPVTWIATAHAYDEEMRERIQHHQAERPNHWQTIECPFALAQSLAATTQDFIVIDCLTLWLSNWLCSDNEADWQLQRHAFLMMLEQHLSPKQRLLMVSNEVGFGIVPDNALARRFRDEAGRLHQDIARIADNVTLVVAGIPLTIKNTHHP